MGRAGGPPPDSTAPKGPTRHLVLSSPSKRPLSVREWEEIQKVLRGESMNARENAIVVYLLAAFASSALATEPRAVITGPKESRPGALVVLDATESTGIGRMWLLAVSPEPTSFLPVENGLKCIFASPTPGEYVFILVVSGTNANGGPAAAMAQHTVTLLGPRPPPDPPKPPIPPPSSIQSVMILRESGDQDATLSSTINQLRNNLELSKRIHLVADPNMKNPLDGQPIPLIEAAEKLVGNEPLPRLIGLDSSMVPVGHQPMPADYSAAVDALKAWGIE